MAEERGNSELRRWLKSFKKILRRGRRRNVFSQHVVNPWNNEKREWVQARKSSGFKEKFNRANMSIWLWEAREKNYVMLYKLIYRMDNVDYRVFLYFSNKWVCCFSSLCSVVVSITDWGVRPAWGILKGEKFTPRQWQ